jgi:Galactose oxidase, central domain
MLWTQLQDIGPPARYQVAAAYDEGRERFVLFGGLTVSGADLGDTWEWDGELWTQVADTGPSPRFLNAMVYDSERKRTVLFGGQPFPLHDTWEWDGEDWTQVTDKGPGARSSYAMAFDDARKEVVLHGGYSPAGGLGDTWAWDGADWTQKDDVGPGARFGHAMAFDANRARATMFGGGTIHAHDVLETDAAGHSFRTFGSVMTPFGDTWEWDGGKWAAAADTGPAPRWGHNMAYDGKNVLLFGGAKGDNYPSDLFGDTWAWDGKHWTQVQDIGPGARAYPGMAFDSARGRVVLFGGLVQSQLGDTWEWFDHSTA